MRKTTLLFDFDFTLADSSQGIFKCINYALRKMNLSEHNYKTIKQTIGYSLPETFKMLTKRNSEEEAHHFVKFFVEKADEIMNLDTKVYPEVFELIPKLKERCFKIGIISTKYRYRIQGVLEKENLDRYFDTIIGGEDVSNHKPHPEGLYMAIKNLGVTKKEAWYVGDSLVDAKAAKQAGIEFIAVLTGTTKEDDFAKEKYGTIIKQLVDLCKII